MNKFYYYTSPLFIELCILHYTTNYKFSNIEINVRH